MGSTSSIKQKIEPIGEIPYLEYGRIKQKIEIYSQEIEGFWRKSENFVEPKNFVCLEIFEPDYISVPLSNTTVKISGKSECRFSRY